MSKNNAPIALCLTILAVAYSGAVLSEQAYNRVYVKNCSSSDIKVYANTTKDFSMTPAADEVVVAGNGGSDKVKCPAARHDGGECVLRFERGAEETLNSSGFFYASTYQWLKVEETSHLENQVLEPVCM